MPDFVASLGLDASAYQSGIEGLGPTSQRTFDRVSAGAKEMGQKLGASVSAGGAQAQKAVEGVGAQGEASASKIEKAFGHIRWEHLLGAFALIRSGMAAMEFDFSTAAAHGEMADAILADNALGVLKAQKDIAESDRKFLASLPVIGAALSHLWDNDIKGMDDAMKKEEGMQKALEKDAEMVKKWDYEVALNKAKMTGSKAEEQRVEAAFKGEEEQEKVAALEERVRDALNAQVDAQQKLGQSRMTGAEQVADLLASGAKGGSSLARTILLVTGAEYIGDRVVPSGMHESEQYLARKVVLDQANKDLAQAQTNLAAARKDEAALAQHRADEITKTQQTETEDLQGQVANAMGYADGGYVSGQRPPRRAQPALGVRDDRARDGEPDGPGDAPAHPGDAPRRQHGRRAPAPLRAHAERGPGYPDQLDAAAGEPLRVHRPDLARGRREPGGGVRQHRRHHPRPAPHPGEDRRADRAGQVANAMGYADGGYVSGPSGIDTVPAWLSPGEYVVNSLAAERNVGWLEAINNGVTLPVNAQRFAGGGQVQHSRTVNLTANITVNPPPGANPRDIARAVVNELARLKDRGN